MDATLTYPQVKEEVNHLKQAVKSAASAKEQWFQKKEDLKQEIKKVAQEIQGLQSQQNSDSSQVKQIKKQRDLYNSEVKKLIQSIKDVKHERKKMQEKYGGKLAANNLLKSINELEAKVEVETNFTKEKKFMDQIKKLKKQYNEQAELQSVLQKEKELSQKIAEMKKKADEFHQKLLDVTEQSRPVRFFEKMKQIVKLKKEQEEAFQKFIDEKKAFLQLQSILKIKQETLDKIRPAAKPKTAPKKMPQINTEEVENKIRNGGRLTTEDLLAFQGASHEP